MELLRLQKYGHTSDIWDYLQSEVTIRVPHFAHISELNAADRGLFVAI